MRYEVGRFRRPMRRSTEGQLVGLVDLGDGSTLSLDFTAMSGLDSRFTFSRASTATFINSSGLVQYADHNLFLNTVWTSGTTPTGWNVLFGTGTTTWNADGTVTMTAATSQRPCINHNTLTVTPGLLHTFGYLATNVTGSPQIADVIHSNVVGETYAINGVTVASSAAVQSGDVVSCTFSPTTTTSAPRLGPGAQSGVSNMSVTASQPRMNVGSSLLPYIANTSTTAAYHAPRFDHDPATLAPKGLLLEGSVTNLLCWSETFATSGGTTNWFYNLNSVSSESVTNPAGGATSIQFRETGGSGPLGQNVSAPSTDLYTFSVWVRGSVYNGVTTTQCRLAMFDGSVYVTISISKLSGPGSVSGTQFGSVTGLSLTEWTRVQITTAATFTAGATFGPRIFSGSTALETDASVLVWGAQLEVGSGASSYIPTGAGTVQRAAEVCEFPFDAATYGYSGEPNHTFALGWNIGVNATSGFPGLFEIRDSGGNRCHGFTTGSGATPSHFSTAGVISGTTITNCTSATTQPIGVNRKIAASVIEGASGHNLSVNGAAATAQSVDPSSVLRTPTRLVTAVTQIPSATLQFVKFYPFAMTSKQLDAITS